MKENIPLSEHCFYKTGGNAKYFVEVQNEQGLIDSIVVAKEKGLPFLIIGSGSNILVSDEGFDGLIIKTMGNNVTVKNNNVIAWAGTLLLELVKVSIENNLTGSEWCAGIPGTIGGAVFGNAGACQKRISDIVTEVKYFDIKDSQIKILSKEECNFSYRESIFKEENSKIILSCTFELEKGNEGEIKIAIKENILKRDIQKQYQFPSAGCVFKNPDNKSAGKIIDYCGLKGKTVGGARVSLNHANFIENVNNATSKDIFILSEEVKKIVKEKAGIELEYENVFVGKFF